jgi:Concanavalin A-like lectin/glucanases superfamily
MKKLKNLVTVIILMIAVTAIIQSCKKNTAAADYNSDKSKLTLQIDSATTFYDTTKVGKQQGDYPTTAKTALKTAIDLATGVKTGTTFTQQQVNNALASLMRAVATYKTNLVQAVSPANLVAFWKFTGNANDSSGNGHNGVLKTNYVGATAAAATDGGTLPVLTADRYGAANSAYAFNNGAYIEIPYDPALYPGSFTISVWVKPQTASNGNYIFSIDHYYGYKLQLQSNNFPFLTVSTDTGIHDEDDNPGSVQLNQWSHVIVTFANGIVTFYINGTLTKTVDATGNLIPVKTIVNACIGNELPKSAYNFTDTTNPNYFYGASFFIGALDDIRLYNKALSATEINSLFVSESTN